MFEITIKKGRDKSLLRHHPWLFSGAIARVAGEGPPGDSAEIYDANGKWLARGAYSPHSQIRVRLWTFLFEENIDKSFFLNRLRRCVKRRESWFDHSKTNAYRLVYAESDGLPGLIVDRYDNVLVCQFLSAGAEFWRDEILEGLCDIFPQAIVYERSDTPARELEGLPSRSGSLHGNLPSTEIRILENGLAFLVDVASGHKTGFYLDQRKNREIVARVAGERTCLNAFSYTGGFGIYLLAGGAREVIHVDTSQEALDLAHRIAAENELDLSRLQMIRADVFEQLRFFKEQGKRFDLIVLDPPKFAASSSQVAKAARGYKDINRLSFELLNPGGILATFSCSGHISPALFQKIVADAAIDAGVSAQIIDYLWQDRDHPVALHFPEALYLKGLLVQKE